MKVTLIFPNRNLGRKKNLDAVTPPLGLAYLAAVLEKSAFEVEVIDAFAENISFNELKKRLSQTKSQVVGITTNVDIIFHALWTAKIVKELLPKTIIVLGGPYATVTYESILKYKFVDYVVLGEGEYTFNELLTKIQENLPVESVRGIAFRNKNQIMRTQDHLFIEDLDQLPFPAWHFFPDLSKYKYFTLTARGVPIITSRGCPNRCIFCTKCVHGYRIRYRSPENVFNEMKYCIEKYNATEFGIVDDHFGSNPQRVKKLCNLIMNSQLKIKFFLANGIRADVISRDLLDKLKRAGCWFVGMGIESGNQEVLNKIRKNVTLDQITESIEICKEFKMLVTGYFVIGLPYDNNNTINDTIKFAKHSKLDLAIFNKAIPVPGTEMFNLIEKHGKFTFPLEERFLIGMNTHYEGPFFEIWDLKREDVIKGHKRAYREFYFRPRKLISLLTKIHSRRQLKYILTYFKNVFLR